MLSISDNNQADAVKSFNYTSRKLNDLLNIDNFYFEQMVGQIYPIELQSNKTNYFYTEAPFLDFVLSNLWHTIYDKRDDFNFYIVYLTFLFVDGHRSPWCIYFTVYSFCKSMFKCK